MKWYRKAVAQGNAKAQYNLGFMYKYGQGVTLNYAKAAKWYRKAADQGLAEAQSNLGVMYVNGQGVAQDYTEAVKWYRKAAEQGYAMAQFNLGRSYEFGDGVPISTSTAVEWYYKAGMNFIQEGQIDEAWAAYDRIRLADSGHPLFQELGKSLSPYTNPKK